MPTFSLCMIVRNEEDALEKCLESVRDIVDEIIIVDTGSSDATKGIAQKFTPNIYDFKWIDDFSAARNFSFSKATMDYILWLDADDVILGNDAAKLKQLKENIDPAIDVVMMKYNFDFDEFGNVTLCFSRERLLKRSSNPIWYDPVHEFIDIDGNIINSDICITHKKVHDISDMNLKIFKKMISDGKKLSPRNLFYYGKELYCSERYDEAIEYLNKFLDSNEGWIDDIISACYHLSICYNIKNDRQNILKTLFKSFGYDLPRAEICCQLGSYFLEEENYLSAIFWYQLALNLEKPKNRGFLLEDCWGYVPNIQLCVCYYRIGNIEESIKYNKKAAEYKPNSSAVIYNNNFFENMKKEPVSMENTTEQGSWRKLLNYLKNDVFWSNNTK